jgi:hypothetical protein
MNRQLYQTGGNTLPIYPRIEAIETSLGGAEKRIGDPALGQSSGSPLSNVYNNETSGTGIGSIFGNTGGQQSNPIQPGGAVDPIGFPQQPSLPTPDIQQPIGPTRPSSILDIKPYTPKVDPNRDYGFNQYGFDSSLLNYLNQQKQGSFIDAGTSYNYDPTTQTFSGGNMMSQYGNIPLSVLQQVATSGDRNLLQQYQTGGRGFNQPQAFSYGGRAGYQMGGTVEQAENFYTNNLGMNPQEARAVLSDALNSYSQIMQPQSMMQMASNGGRIGYQMGGVSTMPMDYGQSLQVPQMSNPSLSPMQSMPSSPMLNYGQTPLSMNRGGIARLGYQMGGEAMMQPQMSGEMNMPQMDPQQALETIVKILIANGIPPEQAQQLAQQILQIFIQGGEPAVEAFANQLEQQEQAQAMASGGIAGYGYRQGYFLGGIGRAIGSVVGGIGKAVSGVVKGVANAVKGVLKSDIGKLALMAGAIYFGGPALMGSLGTAGAATAAAETAALAEAGLGGLGASAIAPEVASMGALQGAGVGAGLGIGPIAGVGTTVTGAATTTPGFFGSIGQGFKDFAADPAGKLAQYGSEALDYASKNKLQTALTGVNLLSLGAQLGMPKYDNESDEDYSKRLKESQGYITNYGRNLKITNPYFYQKEGAVNPFAPTMAANGGIMGYAKGGSMVPPARQIEGGVIELDARKSGGYIPYGKKERHDDVPAMLAKDEFVFTSKAVKAAGGGDAKRGAAKMYAIMKQLEGARA